MWLEEALRVITRVMAIKLLLQNYFLNTLHGYIKFKKIKHSFRRAFSHSSIR